MDKTVQKLESFLNGEWNSNIVSSESKKTASEHSDSKKSADVGVAKNDDGWNFRKASPLKCKPEFKCEECDSTYTNGVSYRRHCKDKHDKIVKVELPTTECLLPHAKGTRGKNRQTMDFICTHLRDVSIYVVTKTLHLCC